MNIFKVHTLALQRRTTRQLLLLLSQEFCKLTQDFQQLCHNLKLYHSRAFVLPDKTQPITHFISSFFVLNTAKLVGQAYQLSGNGHCYTSTALMVNKPLVTMQKQARLFLAIIWGRKGGVRKQTKLSLVGFFPPQEQGEFRARRGTHTRLLQERSQYFNAEGGEEEESRDKILKIHYGYG